MTTHHTVGDVMTRDVFTVDRYASFKAVASLLADAEISAVPVVDVYDHPVGIVSLGDLLGKEAAQPWPDPEHRGQGTPAHTVDSERAEAECADALMTGRLFTAEPQWSVVRAARIMDQHRVKRLPVVDSDGVLVGIVSRSDLLRVFLRPDRVIREEVLHDVLDNTLKGTCGTVRVAVVGGVVTLHGEITDRLRPILRRLCRAVDGVVAVHDEMTPLPDAVPRGQD